MKLILRALKVIAIIFGLLILVVVGVGIYAAIDKTDAFYVNGASFSDFDLLNKIDEWHKESSVEEFSHKELNVYIHRLIQGQGSVYAYRKYSNGSIFLIDDETFEKITIWVDGPQSYPVELSLNNQAVIKAAYTRGGSAWPKYACSGYVTSGSVFLKKSITGIAVHIKGKVMPAGSGYFGFECKAYDIDREFSASKLDYSQLTPWLGLPSNEPYLEIYR